MIVCLINTTAAQETIQDSLPGPDPAGAAWRSVLLPGWGQIYQERLVPGAIFYAASIHFYYQTAYRLHQYNRHDSSEFFKKALRNLSFAAFFHIGSVADAAWVGFTQNPPGWQGHLLGDKPLKSPWGATLRSAIIPGWGQVYNENYWKAILYLGVDGYLMYKVLENDRYYTDTGEGKFRDRRSRYAWYFGLAYLVTMMDAHVGAYLYKFDKAMSLALTPVIMGHNPGIAVHVHF